MKKVISSYVKKVALIVVAILLIPLVLTFIPGTGWNWGALDFVIMGILMFITGMGITFTVLKISNLSYRIVAILAIIAIFLLIWAELAVNAISKALAFLF